MRQGWKSEAEVLAACQRQIRELCDMARGLRRSLELRIVGCLPEHRAQIEKTRDDLGVVSLILELIPPLPGLPEIPANDAAARIGGVDD